MSFWKTLLGIGGAVAAPFTGGASLMASLPGMIGSAAGGIAQGMGQGRQQENTAAADAASFKLREKEGAEDALQGRANLDLKQRQHGMDSQNNAYGNALRSALAMNMKDVVANRPEGIPNISFSGGMRPSAIGAEGRDAAALMNKLAMEKLMSGEKFDALPPIERVAPPQFKNAGAWENILGGVGMAGNAIDGIQTRNQEASLWQELLKKLEGLNGNGGSKPDPLGTL